MKKAFIDTETSHLHGFAVSIAIIITDENENILSEYYREINPGVKMDPEAIAVHKITEEMVENLPTFSSFEPEITEMLNSVDIIYAQNAMFDIGVLLREYQRLEKMFPVVLRNYFDTMAYFKNNMTFVGKIKFPKLSEAAEFFGVSLDGVILHNALDDTRLMLETYKACKRRVP